MRRDLIQYIQFQVFLNYPFDSDFACLEDAFAFSCRCSWYVANLRKGPDDTRQTTTGYIG